MDFGGLLAGLGWGNVASLGIHSQIASTCYAASAATVIRAALRRIRGYPVPAWQDLYNELRNKYGCDGANTAAAVNFLCEKYGIQSEIVDEDEATDALRGGRAIIARFSLSGDSWTKLSTFFKNNPEGVLRQRLTDGPGKGQSGHAVVVVGEGASGDTWILKNSWGVNFANEGVFTVAKDALPFEYIDVWWTESDLRRMGRWQS